MENIEFLKSVTCKIENENGFYLMIQERLKNPSVVDFFIAHEQYSDWMYCFGMTDPFAWDEKNIKKAIDLFYEKKNDYISIYCDTHDIRNPKARRWRPDIQYSSEDYLWEVTLQNQLTRTYINEKLVAPCDCSLDAIDEWIAERFKNVNRCYTPKGRFNLETQKFDIL